MAETINVIRFIYETDESVMKKRAVIPHNRMLLVNKGSGSLSVEQSELEYSAGMLIFVFDGESIVMSPKEPTEYMYIDFSGARADGFFSRFGINKANRAFRGFDGLIPLWYDSISRATEDNIDLAAEGMLLYTFSRFKISDNSMSDIVNRIIEITEENFTDSSLSITDIAAELSYNSKYLSHVFKKKMNVRYSEYLRNLRIKYAIALLDNGIDSIKNVAILSGFSDPLYFSSVFKKMVGVSPKDYKDTND